MASRLQLLMASVLVWLPFLMCVVYGQASIRVKEIQDMDPSQGDTNSIGILNTIYTNNVGATTTRGLLIDAGSGGSRIHVYEWGPRIFQAVPPPISYPTTNEKYTGRISNGVQLCWREGQTEADLLANIKEHLAPLVDFARAQLAGMEDEFATIPIWFKATGGARELTAPARQQLMTGVRQLLSDKDVCPFYFHYSMARIISGEEEAVFSWACMNFLYGQLIPESQGMGQVITGGNSSVSYGTIDLGGSSTQIAFYLPSEDIMEGLYKLQIGGQKHWNVYTKSFLKFGLNSARRRHFELLAATELNKQGYQTDQEMSQHVAEARSHSTDGSDLSIEARNPCFHRGYTEVAQGLDPMMGRATKGTEPVGVVDLTMTAGDDATGNGNPYDYSYGGDASRFLQCRAVLRPLMEKESNDYCTEAYNGDCSIGGQYQPALPQSQQHFMGTSTYKVTWKLLRLPSNASLSLIHERAVQVCDMDYDQILQYINDFNISGARDPQYFCFSAVYTLVLLQDGYGFWPNSTVTVVDTVRGNKVGWPLGAILHEINNLPWELEDPFKRVPWGSYVLSTLIGILIGAVGAFYVSKELGLGLGLDTDSNAQGRGGPPDGVELTSTNYSPTRSEVSEGSPLHWQERIQQREPLFQASPAAAGVYQALGDSSAHAPDTPAKV